MTLGSHKLRWLITAVAFSGVLATLPGWAPAATAATAGSSAAASARSPATALTARSSRGPAASPQEAPLLPTSLPRASITTEGQTFARAGQLVLQESGPCDPMIEVLSFGGSQWEHPHAEGEYTSYNGQPWVKPGYGCGAEAFLDGTEGSDFDLDSGFYPLWYVPCTTPTAQTRSAPGAECLGAVQDPAGGQTGVEEYGVASPTLQIPVSCLNNYDAPSGYFPMTGNAADDRNADNNSPGLEGNTVHCSVSAQQYVPGTGGKAGSWQQLGSSLSLTSAIPTCASPGTCPNRNVIATRPLTISLPEQVAVQGAEVRLVYSAYVGQNGTLDGSGVTDDPIGTTYCQQAIALAAVARKLGKPIPINYDACHGTKADPSSVGYAYGMTPPAIFRVEPTALSQLAVLPYKITYQPPGDNSAASLSVTKATETSTKVSLAQSVADSHAEDTSTTLGGSVGGGLGSFFTANISYSHTWETNEAYIDTRASTTANEDDITAQNETTWNAGPDPDLDNPADPPWMGDTIDLMVHPQFALWDLATCSAGAPAIPPGSDTPACPAGSTLIGGTGEEPVGTQNAADAELPISTLLQGLRQGSLQLPSIYNVVDPATGKSVPLVLSSQDLRGLIGLDPFAATALGLETPPPSTDTVPSGPGQAVDPAPLLAAPGQTYATSPFWTHGQGSPGKGANFTMAKALSSTAVKSAITDTSSTYDATVTDISVNKESVETGVHIPIIDLFSVNGGATATYTTTRTTGVDAKITYDTTDTTALTVAQSTAVSFNDSKNGIYTNVWLDPRWGTFAFQVLQPTVDKITPSSGWPAADSTVTVNGSGFWSGPAEVLFCPQAGACQQGTIKPGYQDGLMHVVPPSMPAGTVADVRVLTDGGRSDTSAADRFTYGKPGAATIRTAAPASGPPGAFERIVATGFHPGEKVTVSFPNGSVPVATPTANAQGVIDGSFALPAAAPGTYQVKVAGQTSGNLATAQVTITPRLTLHAASGKAGQTIVASLLSFSPGQAASLHWGSPTGPVLAHGTTDTRGSLTTTLVVPQGLGKHTIYAVTAAQQTSAVFDTTSTPAGSALGPGLLTPATASPGTQVLVHAVAGTFTPGDTVTVTLPSGQYRTVAGSNGSLLSTVLVRSAPTESYPVTVTGAQGGTETAALTVAPGIHLFPASGTPGQSILAILQGFPQAAAITLHWGSPTGTLLTASPARADSFGSKDVTFKVPSTAKAGAARVYAVGPSGMQASAIFTVT